MSNSIAWHVFSVTSGTFSSRRHFGLRNFELSGIEISGKRHLNYVLKMSAIEYNNLLFEISQRLEELNVLDRLLFMCRGNLSSRSEDNIPDVLSLFKELEEHNNHGTDRLEVIKGLLKSFKEWSFFGRVKEFERKRKKYNDLLEQIIVALDELNELERLIEMCRGNISQESEGQIRDVRSLFKELENQNNLEDFDWNREKRPPQGIGRVWRTKKSGRRVWKEERYLFFFFL